MQLMPDKADNQYYYFMDLRCRYSEFSYPVLAGLERLGGLLRDPETKVC